LAIRALLRSLCQSPAGRIVLVSNAGKYPDSLDFRDLQHGRGKASLAVAGRTQFADDLLTVELAVKPIQVPERACKVERRSALWQESEALVCWLIGTLDRPPVDANHQERDTRGHGREVGRCG
jgi:hypothetical protein